MHKMKLALLLLCSMVAMVAAAHLSTKWVRTSKACTAEEWSIQSGDRLTHLFTNHGFSKRTVYRLLSTNDDVKKALSRLKVGQVLQVCHRKGELQSLQIPIDHQDRWVLTLEDDQKWHAKRQRVEYQTEIKQASLTIEHSFEKDALAKGLSRSLIWDVKQSMQHKIRFAKDLRVGDRFDVIYEKIKENKKIIGTQLRAVRYKHGTKEVPALYFTDSKGRSGFFDEAGRSIQLAFDRVPLKYRRISSHFHLKRHHPVLGIVRPHYGVDLAAPTGTIIRSTGDGVVQYVGMRGGYGRLVEIRHGNRYRTLYGHMSRFAKGLHRGQKVSRGQVIGYVGSSGLASGPHCHYEVRINGRPKDPLRVDLPTAKRLVGADLERFHAKWKNTFDRLKSEAWHV